MPESASESIVAPHDHDVLSGRGNFVNYHAGNEHFRALVRKHKMAYVACPKPQKGKFSRVIVDEIRARNPPGRFLKQDNETKLWYDIGDKKALDKTRQALREGAPELLRDLEPEDEDEGERNPTQHSLQQQQGYGTATGYGADASHYAGAGIGAMASPNVVASMGNIPVGGVGGVGQIPLNHHRIVPGLLNIPAGTTQLGTLRGSSGAGAGGYGGALAGAIQAQEQQQQLQSNIYQAEFEPTPINPSAQLRLAEQQLHQAQQQQQQHAPRTIPLRGIQRDDSLTFENLWQKDKTSEGKPHKKMEGSSQHLSAMSFSIGDMTDASNLSAVFEDSMRISDDATPLVKIETKKSAASPSVSSNLNFSQDVSSETKKKPAASSTDMSLGSLGLESSMMHMSFKSGLDEETTKEER